MLGLLEDLELQVDLADSGMKIDDEAMLRVPSQDDISLDVDKGDSGTDHIMPSGNPCGRLFGIRTES